MAARLFWVVAGVLSVVAKWLLGCSEWLLSVVTMFLLGCSGWFVVGLLFLCYFWGVLFVF